VHEALRALAIAPPVRLRDWKLHGQSFNPSFLLMAASVPRRGEQKSAPDGPMAGTGRHLAVARRSVGTDDEERPPELL